jgi:hypothetical protein
MKKAHVLLISVFVFIFAASSAFAEDYPLTCRGPLAFVTSSGGNTTVIVFAKNATKAGDNGISLKPGTCSWHDRTVNATEPIKIFLKEFKGVFSSLNPSFVAFLQCAQNSNCVIRFRVHNVSNDHYEMGYNDAAIAFPAF